MINKSPAFQFYVQDFLIGTLSMTAEEVGGYIRLLAHQWDAGSIPNDDAKLIKLTGARKKALPAIKIKFVIQDDGTLKNSRLEKVRAQQEEFRMKQKDKANKRWHESGNAAASIRHQSGISQTDALHSSSSTSSSTSNSDNRQSQLKIKDHKIQKGKKTFIPPEQEQVKIYFKELQEGIWTEGKIILEATKFYAHYKAVDWKKGKAQVMDWRALVTTWITNDKTFNNETTYRRDKKATPTRDNTIVGKL